METKEKAEGHEDQSQSIIWKLDHGFEEKAVKVDRRVQNHVHSRSTDSPRLLLLGYRRTQSEFATKAWRWGDNSRDERYQPSFNPELDDGGEEKNQSRRRDGGEKGEGWEAVIRGWKMRAQSSATIYNPTIHFPLWLPMTTSKPALPKLLIIDPSILTFKKSDREEVYFTWTKG
ncbi:hypothetical protein GOBAR_DD10715 [Gossypium barbadense]|nr:hypothetical protein GOBAR_DD10715 [Gossypium barbadense]